MITYMNKQYKLVQFPLYVVLFALFFSCGENDADFTFSDSLKNKYSDAVLGEYETKDTVRSTAKKFGVSKSTVHKDVSERLVKINNALAKEVREVLNENKAERHIRGGMATKLKYENERKKK